jgi:outer membrane protein
LTAEGRYFSTTERTAIRLGVLVGIAFGLGIHSDIIYADPVMQPALEQPVLAEPKLLSGKSGNEQGDGGKQQPTPAENNLAPSLLKPLELVEATDSALAPIQTPNSQPKPIVLPTLQTPTLQAAEKAKPESSENHPISPSQSVPHSNMNATVPAIPTENATALPFDSSFIPQGTPVSVDPFQGAPNASPPSESTPIDDVPAQNGLPQPYWLNETRLAMKSQLNRSATIDLDSLIWAALAHSPFVQSIQIRPQILETEVNQAHGEFDPTRFASSIWNDRSDPVGNTLTAGRPLRLNEQQIENKAGVRKKNEYGGNWEAAQELGLRDSNSDFFVPRKQADSKMVMRYTQPLMKGAGRSYNRASITIAQLNFDASNHETRRSLQSHVMDIIESYWELAYQRALVLQMYRGISRIQTIENQLNNRSDLDAIRNQLLRARSTVDGLKGRYARSLAQVVQSEERLRQLVNAPWIQPGVVDELIPTSIPTNELLTVHLEQELDSALMARPDILVIRDQIKAANVRLRIAEQDLRPTLNLVTDLYVRGLNGQYDVANSLGDQFSTGAPSYSGGLEYLRPKNQTAANAIRRSRDLEMRQLLFQLEDRLLQAGAEVRTSVASIQATHAELASSVSATIASQSEVEFLDARWQSGAFLEPTQISLSLEQLLDAEQRLIQAEGGWAASQSQYMISLARLRFATGTLLSIDPFEQPIEQPIEETTTEPTP